MNICESLTIPAKLFPRQTAVLWQNSTITYAELNSLSILAAQQLVDAGVRAGDRVALMLPNTPSFPVWYYATLRIGAIAVSVSTRLAASEVQFVIDDCQAKAFVANADAMALAGDHLPNCVVAKLEVRDSGQIDAANQGNQFTWHHAEPDDPALILYTSGTTGFPKGATLSHGNVRSNVHAFNHLCNMRTHDVVLLAVPLFHCFGQNALLNSVLNVGGTLVMQQKFDLNESKRLIREHQVSQLYGVPMMFQLLLESCTPADLSSINYCFSAAATLPPQIGNAWNKKFGMPIYEGYGLTETSPFASYNHRDKFVAGSIGMPIDSVEMKIVDTQTGADCAPNVLGEIAIRGPNVMLGYWNRKEDTSQAIRNGWFHSGDIGRVDDQGYFYIVDRVKDMIAIGGLKVFPAEVERVLLDHPDVSQAAVVGLPDPVFGEQVIAFVVANHDNCLQIEEKLAVHAKEHLGNYKVPRRFIVVDQLPRNPSGKILKTELRDLAAEERPPGLDKNRPGTDNVETATPATLRPPTLASDLTNVHVSERNRVATRFLQQLVQTICETEKLPDADVSFIDAGLDSLMIVDMAAQLQLEVGQETPLPPTLIFDYPRIADMADYLVTQLTPRQDRQPNTKDPAQKHLDPTTDLRTEIERMSEDQALQELMKELN